MLLNRLKYTLFDNAKGLFCVTQVECSSNNVIRLLRNFPTSLGVVSVMQLTFPEFHFETEAKVDFPSASIQQRGQNFEQMFSILNRALSWAVTSFGNKFCLKKRSRLIKALDNRF